MNIEYVSLGGNCSIAYQLHLHKLRNYGYPFDWSSSTITQLIEALKNNCNDFGSSLNIKTFSSSHPYIELYDITKDKMLKQSGTYKCVNKYGFKMCHELLNKDNIEVLKETITRRTLRLYDLKNSSKDKLIFVRLEMKVINVENYILKLKNLIEYLTIISGDKPFVLKIILYKINNDIIIIKDKYIDKNLVEFYFYNSFDSDWTMSRINWKEIF